MGEMHGDNPDCLGIDFPPRILKILPFAMLLHIRDPFIDFRTISNIIENHFAISETFPKRAFAFE